MLNKKENIVFLHGLGRTSKCWKPFSNFLKEQGYQTHSIDYPSTKYSIETLSLYVEEKLEQLQLTSEPIHFITHSLGGILVRHLAKTTKLKIAKTVMLAPPNHGSEIVDRLGKFSVIRKVMGPSFCQLATKDTDVLQNTPSTLGDFHSPCFIFAGHSSLDFYFHSFFTEKHDGKVTLSSSRLQGATFWESGPWPHATIMNSSEIHQKSLNFLKS